MFNLAMIIVFIAVAAFSIVVNTVIFYHYKKFNLPGDEIGEKILNLFKWGSLGLISLVFLFLILTFIFE
mgnify:CR=1 FL=1